MKIALISDYFYPKSRGGTEKYVYELAKRLNLEGHQAIVVTCTDEHNLYNFEGVSVYSFEFSFTFEFFSEYLKNEKFDIIHFHTLTPTFNLKHIKISREYSQELYFTAHVPSLTCIHGDLMQFGEKACDGKVQERKCTSCYISKKGFSKKTSNFLGEIILGLKYPRKIANAVLNKKNEYLSVNNLCDKIYLFTNWQKRIFLENGFEDSKLVQTQQMELPKPFAINNTWKLNNPIIIGFSGRICEEKGLHVLINNFIKANKKNVKLHIAGIISDINESYFLELKTLTKNNKNINWNLNLNEKSINEFYSQIDLLCIPSIWYETGPYVLYEAFKNKLPILANNLGDMQTWKDKGYHIELYNNEDELHKFINNL